MSTTLTGNDGDDDREFWKANFFGASVPDWGRLAAASERRARQRRMFAATAAALAVFAASLALTLFTDGWVKADKETPPQKPKMPAEPIDPTPFVWIMTIALACAVVALIFFLITRRQYMKNQNEGFTAKLKAQADYHREALEKLRKTTELATLMELNQDQIGRYHRIVTEQADKAFKSSRMAMGVGLFLLVLAACGGAYVPLEEIRWFIAALAAFSTLLSGFVSRTYMTLYRDSIGQLNRYFDQPVLNSYYLTAERLAQNLDREHVVEVRRQIINEVLATSSRMGAGVSEPSLEDDKPKRKPPKKEGTQKACTEASRTVSELPAVLPELIE
ncbi:hypothetical protein [Streptomyces sp. KR80]|uniref:hypothetical protein n=1 Tax=Streptomyces sp. KR80 TaxID=3457426 RepID=UPI003FCF287F